MSLIRLHEEDGFWKGILVDGYLPKRERLEAIYKKHFRPIDGVEPFPRTKEKSNDDLLFDSIKWIKGLHCNRMMQKYPSLLEKRKGKVRQICSCDLYVVGIEENHPIQSPLNYFSEEFNFEKNKQDYRIIVLFEKKCPEPVNCVNQALEKVEFSIKQPDDYKNYEEFKKAANELLDKGSCYFNAPCMMFANDLGNSGFYYTF